MAQVALDQADVGRYDAMAKFKQVTAPFDGRITERRIDIGNLVTAGSNASTTPLYRLAQNTPMRVFIDAPQATAASMKKGVEAKITCQQHARPRIQGQNHPHGGCHQQPIAHAARRG